MLSKIFVSAVIFITVVATLQLVALAVGTTISGIKELKKRRKK